MGDGPSVGRPASRPWGPGPSRPATWRVSCFGGAGARVPAAATPPEVLGQGAASGRRRAGTDVGALRLSDVCERPAAPSSPCSGRAPKSGRFKVTFLWPQTSAALLPRRGPLVARGQRQSWRRARTRLGPGGAGSSRLHFPRRGHTAGAPAWGPAALPSARRCHQTELRFTETDARAECSGAAEGQAQAPPLSTRSLTLRVLALGGNSLRQICTSCFSQFFPPKSFKCKNLRKRSFRCCPAPRRGGGTAVACARTARRGAVSVGGDGDVRRSDSADLARKPSRELFTL